MSTTYCDETGLWNRDASALDSEWKYCARNPSVPRSCDKQSQAERQAAEASEGSSRSPHCYNIPNWQTPLRRSKTAEPHRVQLTGVTTLKVQASFSYWLT